MSLFDVPDDRTAGTDADMEPNTGNAPVRAEAAARLRAPFRVTFIHTRRRLADVDNLSGKAALDGLISLGVLPDDSPQQVAEVRHRQRKGTREATTIIVEPLNDDDS